MEIFEQIKAEIVNKGYMELNNMNHWQDPGLEAMHVFLSEEGDLTTEQIANIFSTISGFKLYQKSEMPDSEEGWFIEDEILWVVNPWSSRINSIILSNRSLGKDLSELGIFTSQMLQADTQEGKIWVSAPENVIEKAKSLIIQAYEAGASDIHISPRNDDIVAVRFRIFGKVQHIFDLPLDADYKALANTFLQLSGKHAGIYNSPIDSKFIIKDKNLKINIRLAMMPVFILGNIFPRFVLRIHGNATTKALRSLNFLDRQIVLLEESAKYSDGLILNTGPMGSGKTTTLYAMLALIKNMRKGISIQTLEDPVEVNIANIDQTEINNQAGMSYASGLRTMLRSDANVILVGEIRDVETANLAVEAAMTGHLILSTLHARTAMGAISRLVKLGVSPTDLADTLALSVGQRMVRRVCHHCSEEVQFSSFKNKQEIFYHKYIDLIKDDSTNIRTSPKGCDKCNGFGYFGRTLVAEVALVDDKLQELIVAGATMGKLNNYQKETGLLDLWDHGIELVKKQETTLEEMESILPRRNIGYNI